jgi:hypothetical protein
MSRADPNNHATRFKKGERPVGRAVGTPNKITLSARQIIDDAFHGIGGTERLIAWINKSPKNESAWWNNIWVRTLPQSSTVRAEVQHELTPRTTEELAAALEAHGLPPMVFGFDKPVLELPSTLAGGPVLEGTATSLTIVKDLDENERS